MDYPTYDPESAVTPLGADELDHLDRLLQSLPADGAMGIDGMDGFLTALVTGPPAVLASLPTGDWLPAIWGGDGAEGADGAAPFASKRQRKATVVLVLRHLRHLSDLLTGRPQDWEPVFNVADDGPDEWVDASDWCAGFLQAVDLLPSAWQGIWDDTALANALAPLVQLGGGLDAASAPAAHASGDAPDDAQAIDRMSRAVPDAVLQLLARRAEFGQAPLT